MTFHQECDLQLETTQVYRGGEKEVSMVTPLARQHPLAPTVWCRTASVCMCVLFINFLIHRPDQKTFCVGHFDVK